MRTILTSLALAGAVATAHAADGGHGPIRHVLLLSIDGCHAVDLERFVADHPTSALAGLVHGGVVYSDASTPVPSDSFPGMLALATGGTPASTGVYYDDSYSRALWAPGADPTTAPRGTEVVYDESVDVDPDLLFTSVDPAKLPVDAAGDPVFPHRFLRDNTVFEVANWFGLPTAWSDKHPAYELLRGPTVAPIDLFTPEINSAADFTTSVALTEGYDDLKVAAVLDWIHGLDHAGSPARVPAIFGMNFQAVSVGQKLPTAGYVDAAGTPSASLADALAHTDASIGQMVSALDAAHLTERTLIIVTAKHGQSPIDKALVNKVDPTLVVNAVDSVAPDLLAQLTADDIGLIWLHDSSKATAVKAALLAQLDALGGREVLAGDELRARFGWPNDDRRPDVVLLAKPGTIYSTSKKKNAEHGGDNPDDAHVALVVANPHLRPGVVTQHVETRQVAPTILVALRLPTFFLRAVWIEGTRPLPGLHPLLLEDLFGNG